MILIEKDVKIKLTLKDAIVYGHVNKYNQIIVDKIELVKDEVSKVERKKE